MNVQQVKGEERLKTLWKMIVTSLELENTGTLAMEQQKRRIRRCECDR